MVIVISITGVFFGMGIGLLIAYNQLHKTIKPRKSRSFGDYSHGSPVIYTNKSAKKDDELDPIRNPKLLDNDSNTKPVRKK